MRGQGYVTDSVTLLPRLHRVDAMPERRRASYFSDERSESTPTASKCAKFGGCREIRARATGRGTSEEGTPCLGSQMGKRDSSGNVSRSGRDNGLEKCYKAAAWLRVGPTV